MNIASESAKLSYSGVHLIFGSLPMPTPQDTLMVADQGADDVVGPGVVTTVATNYTMDAVAAAPSEQGWPHAETNSDLSISIDQGSQAWENSSHDQRMQAAYAALPVVSNAMYLQPVPQQLVGPLFASNPPLFDTLQASMTTPNGVMLQEQYIAPADAVDVTSDRSATPLSTHLFDPYRLEQFLSFTDTESLRPSAVTAEYLMCIPDDMRHITAAQIYLILKDRSASQSPNSKNRLSWYNHFELALFMERRILKRLDQELCRLPSRPSAEDIVIAYMKLRLTRCESLVNASSVGFRIIVQKFHRIVSFSLKRATRAVLWKRSLNRSAAQFQVDQGTAYGVQAVSPYHETTRSFAPDCVPSIEIDMTESDAQVFGVGCGVSANAIQQTVLDHSGASTQSDILVAPPTSQIMPASVQALQSQTVSARQVGIDSMQAQPIPQNRAPDANVGPMIDLTGEMEVITADGSAFAAEIGPDNQKQSSVVVENLTAQSYSPGVPQQVDQQIMDVVPTSMIATSDATRSMTTQACPVDSSKQDQSFALLCDLSGLSLSSGVLQQVDQQTDDVINQSVTASLDATETTKSQTPLVDSDDQDQSLTLFSDLAGLSLSSETSQQADQEISNMIALAVTASPDAESDDEDQPSQFFFDLAGFSLPSEDPQQFGPHIDDMINLAVASASDATEPTTAHASSMKSHDELSATELADLQEPISAAPQELELTDALRGIVIFSLYDDMVEVNKKIHGMKKGHEGALVRRAFEALMDTFWEEFELLSKQELIHLAKSIENDIVQDIERQISAGQAPMKPSKAYYDAVGKVTFVDLDGYERFTDMVDLHLPKR
ncbi:hypothetical protein ACN47E_010193 [Coniothyrium glycines]